MSANVLNDHRLAHRAPLPRGMAADPRMLGGPLDRNHSPVGMTAHPSLAPENPPAQDASLDPRRANLCN